MWHLLWSGKAQIDIFKDATLAGFRSSLDVEMKRLQSEGKGAEKKQAEIITEEEEDLLWQKGLLHLI